VCDEAKPAGVDWLAQMALTSKLLPAMLVRLDVHALMACMGGRLLYVCING